MRVLIIGGVAAGTKTAAKLKREDRSIDVTVITRDMDISYAGCGLPSSGIIQWNVSAALDPSFQVPVRLSVADQINFTHQILPFQGFPPASGQTRR